MLTRSSQTHHTHTLIIGSGLAGLMCALKCPSQTPVTLVSKGDLLQSNSYYALGGIASVFGEEDSFESHIQDTLEAGDGLCHQDIVNLVVSQGPRAIKELTQWGVMFSKEGDDYHLTREGGHSQRRILHATDRTGEAMIRALASEVQKRDNITVLQNRWAVDLITTDKVKPDFSGNRCLGAYILHGPTEDIEPMTAKRTLLCTGGHGRAYLYTSNPASATGDGLAMAHRAGVKIANMEFMQFHPTALYHREEKNTLISEALRGEGAVLLNQKGEDFTQTFHPKGSLAPRDVVARAIYHDLKKSGDHHVYLDVSSVPTERLKNQFSHITQLLCQWGINILKGDPIPVTPCAHYSCGGVVVDSYGRTSLKGLYAVGEVACTGLHGGNRLASNSLLEVAVMSQRVSEALKKDPSENLIKDVPPWDYHLTLQEDERGVLNHTWDELRRIMWNYVGIVRTTTRLKRALSKISAIQTELEEYYWDRQPSTHLIEVRNLALVARLTVLCALKRKESRGCHYTTDFPEKSSHSKDTII